MNPPPVRTVSLGSTPLRELAFAITGTLTLPKDIFRTAPAAGASHSRGGDKQVPERQRGPGDGDYLSPPVLGWLAAASAELDRNVPCGGAGRCCSRPWACERALAATFVLDVF